MSQSLRRYWALIRVWLTYEPHRNPTPTKLGIGRHFQSTGSNNVEEMCYKKQSQCFGYLPIVLCLT